MQISWLGHACFLIETQKGIKIITDPYEPGSYSGQLNYQPVNLEADIVTISHKHPDHNFSQPFKKAKILASAEKFELVDTRVEGILSYHDNQKGKARGANIIFIISAEGLKIAHFGDLGTLDLDYAKLENIDIAFVPVGGIFTLYHEEIEELYRKLKPKIFIPMHFKTPKIEFKISTVEEFLKGKDFERRKVLEVNKENINSFKKIAVLDYLR
jgi:L-ascorbate metabolism protein UlaG (beta-lactamase superfamily)